MTADAMKADGPARIDPRAELEALPRKSLGWGGGLLILGLGAVGVGASGEGAVLALAGLFLTIYGIHSFGRLGPEDLDLTEDDARAAVARATAVHTAWTGGGVLVMGVAVALGTHVLGAKGSFVLTYGAILAGIVQLARGYLQLQQSLRAPKPSRASASSDDEPEERAPKRRKAKRRKPADGN
ncbi:Hypothetical protein A7982_00414 [Minicystis rosea]|nr:Hypothetical protein A7982_00414 [Minicystis rosea]